MTTTQIQSGFTIIELMITLFIAGILAAIAAPSFTSMIQDNRLVTQVNELQASIALTRSEAIQRNNNTTLCRSANNTACGGNWENGWIAFLDSDGDGNVDGEEIFLVHGGVSGANTIRASSSDILTYTANGLGSVGLDNTFIFCDDRDNPETHARGIVISSTGRARLAIDSDNNGIVEESSGEGGSDVSCP